MKKLISLIPFLGCIACSGAYDNLSTGEFASAIASGTMAVVDVRTPEEYAAGHLHGASCVNWHDRDFMEKIAKAYPKGTPLAVYCRSGRRSAAAAASLSKAGYKVSNMLGGYLAWEEENRPVTTYAVETFVTEKNLPVCVTLIKHGTLALQYKGLTFHVDPVSGFGKPTDYAAEFAKADAVLVTHEHPDHFDTEAIKALSEEGRTVLVTNGRCAEMLGFGKALENGDSYELPGGVHLDAVPAYNYSDGRTMFHPKGRDNGFVLTFDGLRIYVAGDTEDIPEMAALKGVDVAFLPVNQPYTMTVEQCVNAAKVLAPAVLIPYHFAQTDLSALPSLLPGIDVRLRDMQ
ncbi:MAG: MBL fold metallo-hydrolase [Bacteroidales bacterium]|nr:MBL fold metallo-hydrolase [Bacteroidales bacterium]